MAIYDVTSDVLTISSGIQEGGTLGPTLFLMYINELSNLNTGGKIVTFADDTVLLFNASTWQQTQKRAEVGLEMVKRWLDVNILTLNIKKQNIMLQYKQTWTTGFRPLTYDTLPCGQDRLHLSAIAPSDNNKILGLTN